MRAGERAEAELIAEAGTRLRILSDAPWEGGALVVRVTADDEECAHFKQGLQAGQPVDLEVVVPAGLVRWSLAPLDGPDLRQLDGAPARWEGAATLRPGTEWTVRIDD